MARRAPGRDKASTPRRETDRPELLGVRGDVTTGTPLAALIRNNDTHSSDYGELAFTARPGHADYTGFLRYAGWGDVRGGGVFRQADSAPRLRGRDRKAAARAGGRLRGRAHRALRGRRGPALRPRRPRPGDAFAPRRVRVPHPRRGGGRTDAGGDRSRAHVHRFGGRRGGMRRDRLPRRGRLADVRRARKPHRFDRSSAFRR